MISLGLIYVTPGPLALGVLLPVQDWPLELQRMHHLLSPVKFRVAAASLPPRLAEVFTIGVHTPIGMMQTKMWLRRRQGGQRKRLFCSLEGNRSWCDKE